MDQLRALGVKEETISAAKGLNLGIFAKLVGILLQEFFKSGVLGSTSREMKINDLAALRNLGLTEPQVDFVKANGMDVTKILALIQILLDALLKSGILPSGDSDQPKLPEPQ